MKLTTFYLLPAILLPAMIACSNSDDQAIDENLLDVVWRVDTLQTPEEEIVPGPDTLMTIQFTEDMKVSGHADCNDYEGVYTNPENGSLAVDIQAITLMACTEWEFLEYSFLQALENALEALA